MKKSRNLKTTIFGTLAAFCGVLSTQNGIAGTIGTVGSAIFTFLLGASAEDAKKK